jgi:hypothetical protein
MPGGIIITMGLLFFAVVVYACLTGNPTPSAVQHSNACT